MKELNEMELREVEGGLPFSMFFGTGPLMWTQISIMEVAAGIFEGYIVNKR